MMLLKPPNNTDSIFTRTVLASLVTFKSLIYIVYNEAVSDTQYQILLMYLIIVFTIGTIKYFRHLC